MDKISIKQLEQHLSEYLNAGEDFIITKYNKQIAIVSFKNIVTTKPLNEPIVSSFLPDSTLQPANGIFQRVKDTRLNKPVKKPVNKPFKTYFKTKNNPAGL